MFINILDPNLESGSTQVTFGMWPCILDSNPPAFMATGASTINAFTGALGLTIYDYVGAHTYSYSGNTAITNSTIHYERTGGNYVPSVGTGIDNQQGIDTGTLQVSLAQNQFLGRTGNGQSIDPAFPIFSGVASTGDFTNFTEQTYAGPGSSRVRTGENTKKRGYTLSADIIGSNLFAINTLDNQLVTVSVTGSDYANQAGTAHNASTNRTFLLTGFDRVPPYISGALYSFSTPSGVVTTTGGAAFDPTTWTNRTTGAVALTVTGSESMQFVTGSVVNNNRGDTYLALTSGNIINALDTGFALTHTITFTGNV